MEIKKNRLLIRIIFVVILLVLIFNPISTYFVSQAIGNRAIKPILLLRDTNNEVLKQLRIFDYCDPLPCANTYLVLTSTKKLNEDFQFCDYAQISGNIHIEKSGFPAYPLDNFGTNLERFCSYAHAKKYICNKGSTLTKYNFYEFFPYPKKTDLSYYSCN